MNNEQTENRKMKIPWSSIFFYIIMFILFLFTGFMSLVGFVRWDQSFFLACIGLAVYGMVAMVVFIKEEFKIANGRGGVNSLRMDNWISVEDRLPTISGVDYICYAKHLNEWMVLSLVFNRGVFAEENEYIKWNDLVTHWQPLPEPPEDKP